MLTKSFVRGLKIWKKGIKKLLKIHKIQRGKSQEK